MDDITPNMQAYLDLVNDINHLFIGLEYDEPCDICDGDSLDRERVRDIMNNYYGDA